VRLLEARETTIRQETQISIVIVEARQGIEGHAVQRDERGRREYRLFEERYPMETVIVRHDSLNYSIPRRTTPPLYRRYDSQIGSIKQLAGRGNHGKEKTNVGSANTTGTPTERLGNVLRRTRRSELLERPIRRTEQKIKGQDSPSWDHAKLPDPDPCEHYQANDGRTHQSDTDVSINGDAI
jgi:hypothetical protein